MECALSQRQPALVGGSFRWRSRAVGQRVAHLSGCPREVLSGRFRLTVCVARSRSSTAIGWRGSASSASATLSGRPPMRVRGRPHSRPASAVNPFSLPFPWAVAAASLLASRAATLRCSSGLCIFVASSDRAGYFAVFGRISKFHGWAICGVDGELRSCHVHRRHLGSGCCISAQVASPWHPGGRHPSSSPRSKSS